MTVAVPEHQATQGNPPHLVGIERSEELLLAARPSAVSCARMLVGSVVTAWELSQAIALRVSDVVDELVAHAVATNHSHNDEALALLGIRIRSADDELVVEVWDSGSEPAAVLHETVALLRAVRWGYH
ncbi:MAG: ATP-binding protein, partial [Actinomycetota bacterium]|nr:ATP-binding protein [Actinomycetota bacterium]